MRIISFILIIAIGILSALIFGCGCKGLDDSLKPKGIVEGSVVDEATNEGIGGVTVQCGGGKDITDSDGYIL